VGSAGFYGINDVRPNEIVDLSRVIVSISKEGAHKVGSPPETSKAQRVCFFRDR